MARRRLLWQIFPSYLIIIVCALSAVIWYFQQVLAPFYSGIIQDDLRVRLVLFEEKVMALLEQGDHSDLQAEVRDVGEKTGTRITVILQDGSVVADSFHKPAEMDNHQNRPEIKTALREGKGRSERFSDTSQMQHLYVAQSVTLSNGAKAVLRASVPVEQLEGTLDQLTERVLIAGLLVALVAAVVGLVISKSLSRPLEEMRQGAEQFAQGKFNTRLKSYYTEEVASLADSMNKMADQLGKRIATITSQSQEKEAILKSMVEGVVAVNLKGHILSFNQSASHMFRVKLADMKGRRLQGALRNVELTDFIARVVYENDSLEKEIVLQRGKEERFIKVTGNLLRDGDDNKIGVLLVFNDLTKLKRLENVRKDFVANVSHELKTPLTSIKGFVETLLEDGVSDRESAIKFLNIIAKQADRLSEIIEDLLVLSKLEKQSDSGNIAFQSIKIQDILRSAVEICQAKWMAQKPEITIKKSQDLVAVVNGNLLEQAVINLVDNAVKYSEPGMPIDVNLEREGDNMIISVRDYGQGIEQSVLPRLFERFYRVDHARTRDIGGSGLGLAIVKHIAQVHLGKVFVESVIGEGSTFTMVLPLDREQALEQSKSKNKTVAIDAKESDNKLKVG